MSAIENMRQKETNLVIVVFFKAEACTGELSLDDLPEPVNW